MFGSLQEVQPGPSATNIGCLVACMSTWARLARTLKHLRTRPYGNGVPVEPTSFSPPGCKFPIPLAPSSCETEMAGASPVQQKSRREISRHLPPKTLPFMCSPLSPLTPSHHFHHLEVSGYIERAGKRRRRRRSHLRWAAAEEAASTFSTRKFLPVAHLHRWL